MAQRRQFIQKLTAVAGIGIFAGNGFFNQLLASPFDEANKKIAGLTPQNLPQMKTTGK